MRTYALLAAVCAALAVESAGCGALCWVLRLCFFTYCTAPAGALMTGVEAYTAPCWMVCTISCAAVAALNAPPK